MKYKAIVSDFDGTLSDKSLKLTEPVKSAIKSYISAGGTFSIATGRDYYGALKGICEELGIKSLHIVRGGSEIVSSETHEVVWGKYIDEKVLIELLKLLRSKKDVFFVAERGKLIYTAGGEKHAMFGDNAEFGVLEDFPTDSVPKVFLPPPSNRPEIALPLIEELQLKFPELHIIRTGNDNHVGMDINDGGVSKHLAMLEYLKLTGLDQDEVIGVGDSYNDYPLLSACGFKVAMGNAPKELTKIADMVVGTQENDGIIEVIEFAK